MKTILLISIIILATACAPSKVCGGSGGKRCVDITSKTNSKTIS